MKALVLAAGLGERLRPLTTRIPKPLLEVGGRPLIHYPLLMLKRAGITQIAINLHHLGDEIKRALGDGRALGIEITYAPEPRLLGTAGPLIAMRTFFGGEPFVIANADSISDLRLDEMVAYHRRKNAIATLALGPVADSTPYGRIETDADGRIRRIRLPRGTGAFDDYPARLDAAITAALNSNMYRGVIVAEAALLDELRGASRPLSLMTGLFAPMVERGAGLYGYIDRGYFRTVDDLASYDALRAEFAAAPPRLWYL